jgi:hypothetical protein
MDWTYKDYAHANHNPVVVVNGQSGTGPILIDAVVGKQIELDATGTRDPDGQTLHYSWFHYPEAGGTGTNLADVRVEGASTSKTTVTATAVCRALWLPNLVKCSGDGAAHIILAVTDDGTPRLTSYRRIILTVHSAEKSE